jgi:hypothetical protein
MNAAYDRGTGRLAVAVGVVAAGSAICLATYFVARGPFGTINDIGNATTGVLSAALAWRLRRYGLGRAGDATVAGATVGAAITVVGSALVISGTTGFLFAGLVSSVGFAGIGTWLVWTNRRTSQALGWPQGVRLLGVLGGAVMALGIVVAPGILLGLDDMETAPWWVWLGFVGWLGIYVLYPAWAIRVGLVETRRGRQPLPSGEQHVVDEGMEVRSWTGG